jgi:hypothetical protein
MAGYVHPSQPVRSVQGPNRVHVRVCVRVCVYVCVRACACACVCVCGGSRPPLLEPACMYIYKSRPARIYIAVFYIYIYIYIYTRAGRVAGRLVCIFSWVYYIYIPWSIYIYICIRAGQRTARLLYIYMYMLYPAKYVYEPANRIYTLYIYIINRSVYGRMYDSLSESARPVR